MDPLKSKHLDKALGQFAEEGLASLFKTIIGAKWIVGVVGKLQFDVLESRIQYEYGLQIKYENTNFFTARWLSGDEKLIDDLVNINKEQIANDYDGKKVFLPRIQWDIDRLAKDFPGVKLNKIKNIGF